MATIRERIDASGKKSYHVQVRIKGFPPQTGTFPTKTAAKTWAAHVESELREGRYMPRAQAQRLTVKELLEEYRERVLTPLKPKQVSSQGPQLDWWIKKLGAYSLADLTPAAIGKCRDELLLTPLPSKKRGESQEADDSDSSESGASKKPKKRFRKPATVVRHMAVLSHAFNVAVKEWQWMPESPMSKVTKPKVSNGRLRFLSEDEQSKLLDEAKASGNRYLHTILITALSTGMRYGEIMNLRWRNVHLKDADDSGWILLETTKNGEPRAVPLVKNACVAIKALRQRHAAKNGGKINSKHLLFPSEKDANKPVEIRKAWETVLDKASVRNFRFHDLRHTAASYLAMDGATAPEIAEILGHKSLQMVKRYSHFNKEHIAKVMARMNQSRFGGSTGGAAEKVASKADADSTEK